MPSVQSLSRVQLLRPHGLQQASLAITNSQSLLRLMSTESVMPSHRLILCCPLLLPPSVFPSISSVRFSSVTQSCPTLCNPMNCSTPGIPVITNSRNLFKPMSIASEMPSNHLILCRPLLLPPSVFPSIRVFSNESVLHVR